MVTNELSLKIKTMLFQLEKLYASFDYIKVCLASPLRIKGWANRILPSGKTTGEVLIAKTIDVDTLEIETDGLFCEKIFGPLTSWKCKCGKYYGFLYNKICERCLVEITDNRIRRYRMGYVDLKYPIIHSWYLYGLPNYISNLLDSFNNRFTILDLKNIIFFKTKKNKEKYVNIFSKIIKPKNEIKKFFKNSKLKIKTENFSGSELIKIALENLNLKEEIKHLRFEINFIHLLKNVLKNNTYENFIFNKIRILESFLFSNTNPSWMVLTILPVLPPELRPLYELENGMVISTDINELYKIIIEKNEDYFILKTYLSFFKIYLNQWRISLQESIDSLINNAYLPKKKKILINNKVIQSLTELLEGKKGHFRQLLLGKRVDYSGRSIIIVGPRLRLNQCGLPYKILKEIFNPFLINELLIHKIFKKNLKLIKSIIKNNKPIIWTLLIDLLNKYSILLNRAPTLHRFSLQAFDVLINLGNYITIHPLLCTGFNADFDGDQMAVHLPLSETSQLEIRTMMYPSFNILSPSNNNLIIKPTQDIIIGCYYLTLMINNNKNSITKWFSNENEVLIAFFQKKITIHTSVLIRYINFKRYFKIKNNKIFFIKRINNFLLNIKKIFIYKIFKKNLNSKKIYFITNIGIIISYFINKNIYFIIDLFLETTPGRLIFNLPYKNLLKN